jgi:Flp pilus assembly protein TadD
MGVMFRTVLVCALAGGIAAGPALAMSGGGGGGGSSSPSGGQSWPESHQASKPSEYRGAMKLIKKDQCAEAIPLLEKALEKAPKDADIYNELGFCYRKLGKYTESFDNYRKALEIDPNHKGAREYVGELFLLMNKLDAAEDQLRQLTLLCPKGCVERDTLAKAIDDYKATQAAAPASH